MLELGFDFHAAECANQVDEHGESATRLGRRRRRRRCGPVGFAPGVVLEVLDALLSAFAEAVVGGGKVVNRVFGISVRSFSCVFPSNSQGSMWRALYALVASKLGLNVFSELFTVLLSVTGNQG